MEIQFCLRAPANYQQTNSSTVKLAFFLSFSARAVMARRGLWAQCDSEGIMDVVGAGF